MDCAWVDSEECGHCGEAGASVAALDFINLLRTVLPRSADFSVPILSKFDLQKSKGARLTIVHAKSDKRPPSLRLDNETRLLRTFF